MEVYLLLTTLSGMVQGFPDTTEKLENVARVWARFMSLETYHVKLPRHLDHLTGEERAAELAPFAWKEGIIPGEWLIQKIQDSCEWMPAPVVAREMYCAGGFVPIDGLTPDKLPNVGRRRAEVENG